MKGSLPDNFNWVIYNVIIIIMYLANVSTRYCSPPLGHGLEHLVKHWQDTVSVLPSEVVRKRTFHHLMSTVATDTFKLGFLCPCTYS